MKVITHMLWAALAGGALLMASAAHNARAESVYIDTITVTADKREKKLRDVAGSVSVIETIDIRDTVLNSFQEIHTYVPNFISYGPIGYNSIRGQSNMAGSSGAVGIYVDDVPAKFSELFDIERIEVLRGPQGNLYGLNCAGGVVNIITQKPGDTFKARTAAELGDYDRRAYAASMTAPILRQRLSMRLAGRYEIRDNFVEEQGKGTTEEQNLSHRVQLRWMPGNHTDLLMTLTGEDVDSDRGTWVLKDEDPFTLPPMGLDEKKDARTGSASLRIHHDAGSFELTSVTAKVENESAIVFGMDYLSGGDNLRYFDNDRDNQTWIQEIRLASVDKSARLQWLVGGFYQDQKSSVAGHSYADTGGMAAPAGTYSDMYTDSRIDTQTLSFFGQSAWAVTPRITATAGARYDRDTKDTWFHQERNQHLTSAYTGSSTWESLSPKFALDIKASDRIMAYTSVAKGYKAGGYAYYTAGSADAARFDPEYAWSWESGLKTNWLNNRIITNVCGFYTRVDDIQLMYTDPVTWQMSIKNAARAIIWGFEAEATVRPLPGLTITGSLGLLESEFDRHETKTYEGNKVPLAPGYQVFLGVRYHLPRGLFLGAEGFWNGKSYFDEANQFSQNDFLRVNAKAGYERGPLSISVYLKNAFDRTYYHFSNRRGGVDKCMPADPRTFGVQVAWTF